MVEYPGWCPVESFRLVTGRTWPLSAGETADVGLVGHNMKNW